jgi:hypothetical protein
MYSHRNNAIVKWVYSFWNILHASSCNLCLRQSHIRVIYYLHLLSIFINLCARVGTSRSDAAEASVLLRHDVASEDNT